MSARATDQSGPTGSGNATGHWHNGSWYLNSECPCPLSQAMPEQTSVESAVKQTLAAVGVEFGGMEKLSADVVAYTKQHEPVISVINRETREHWQLVVKALPLAKQ